MKQSRILPALLCCALVLALTGCQAKDEEPLLDQTVTVEATVVQTGDLSAESTYIGTISAEGTASVVSLVSGNVQELAVSAGDSVSAGDLLCRIDDESARLTLQNAQAGYNSAQQSYNSAQASYGGSDLPVLREQVRMAQDNYDNTLALQQIGAASQIEVDQAYQALLSAQSGLEAAEASLSAAAAGIQTAQAGVDAAQYQLSLYHLAAPISGVVEAVNVTENNFAASGTVAFVISNGATKTVTFYVTDQVRQNLTPGQAVTVSTSGQTYTGAITEISGVVDAATGLFKIKAVINDAQALPDGLAVELTTTAYRANGAVLVPSDAVYFDEGSSYVFVSENGTAVRTPVTMGLYTADTIAVTGGLLPGTEVITTWSASLQDGAPIRLADEASSNTKTEDSSAADDSASSSGNEGASGTEAQE
ncbi:MAG: efflux RND transporter periplasmic adaptor subunit [Clostridiales bacterium]|nr:efflux RND transporter periplasmic adaptor subunit [Clostridiales bacterium]